MTTPAADAAFFLPPLTTGSGGHRTVLRYAHGLASRGYQVVCVVEAAGPDVRAEAERIWPVDGVRFAVGFASSVRARVGYATAWHTARTVAEVDGIDRRAYLVQDLERWFHPVGDHWIDAERSLDYGLELVALGRWLQRQLRDEQQQPVHHIDFGIDLDRYRPEGVQPPGGPRVCFLYQPEKPRRMPSTLLEAARRVAETHPDGTVYLFGSGERVPEGPWINVGSLEERDLRDLYAECSVGVVMSTTNPSRVTFEMLASGLPVVDVYRSSTLFDFPSAAVALAVPSAASIARAVDLFIDDRERRLTAARAGIVFAREHPAATEVDQFESAHRAIAAGVAAPEPPAARRYEDAAVVAPEDALWADSYVRRQLRGQSHR